MNSKIKSAKKVLVICLLLMIGVVIGAVILVCKKKESQNLNSPKSLLYEGKYAFIAGDYSDAFVGEVYKAAKEEALNENMYVELMGEKLSNEYSVTELMEMAIASKPDGIIVEADDTEKMTELVNKAVKDNIPVITFMTDAASTDRQCFVGPNYYVLGKKYGEQIAASYSGEKCNVLLLVKNSLSENSRNSFYSSIVSYLSEFGRKGTEYNITIDSIDTSSTFLVEEKARNIVLQDEESADVVVALDETCTTCLYQALVDYNKVGQMEVIGYHNSENILSGISKEVLLASVTVDATQMGEKCVEALSELKETGYVSDYISVDIETITLENVESFMEKEEKDE